MATSTQTRELDPGDGLVEEIVTLPDGRRLRTIVAGSGPGPLVVFEAGMSAPAACWVHTQRQVSAHARTLSYDRAGYGGSDVDDHDRTLERISDDLLALLDARHEVEPVVLVGHSWGGPILRVFADRHPERVAGLVFVDASLAEGLPAEAVRVTPGRFRMLARIAGFGGKWVIKRLTLQLGKFSPEIGKDDLAVMLRDYACAPAMWAGSREAEQIGAALPVLEALQVKGTPPVPTVCLQGGRVDRGMKEIRPLLNDAATALMAAAADGKVVVLDDVGHLIPQEAPQPVLEAILDVHRAARR
jgi:pimeloyl-ACP methyl ester carboxylesterase